MYLSLTSSESHLECGNSLPLCHCATKKIAFPWSAVAWHRFVTAQPKTIAFSLETVRWPSTALSLRNQYDHVLLGVITRYRFVTAQSNDRVLLGVRWPGTALSLRNLNNRVRAESGDKAPHSKKSPGA